MAEELRKKIKYFDAVIPSAYIIAFHKLAKEGYMDEIRMNGRMAEFDITDVDRRRWPQLAEVDKLWLVYEEKKNVL